MTNLVSLIPIFPFIGFLILGLFGSKISKSVSGIIASGMVFISFAISVFLFIQLLILPQDNRTFTYILLDWIMAGNFSVSFSFLLDPLSSLFLLIITGVGFLIHVYSTGYMHDDENHNKFFAYLNLFVFFMLLLVLGSNYLLMFVGWEGVGLCSYLLIGFWFKNNNYNNAAKKAFIMNRIGDLGFLLGIILIFTTFGSIEYSAVFSQAKSFISDHHTLTIITAFLFIGAIGKSAQIPLYTWLPDAMAGPTPVSALIHAATMVTAGIYMITRSNILFALSPITMEIIAVIGLLTALFAATIGLAQNDIKKVLAYSTVSQLGLMFLALGVGAFTSGVFHVMTHAFFKALLFLGAGSVIHAMSGEQDIRKMGGLKKHLPITFLTFMIGTIAISGLPPFAGFFSKDEILAHVFAHNKVFWLLGICVSIMTAFYMFRLFYLTFYGDFKGTNDQLHHLHESPRSITIPLIALAVLSIFGGFLGLPEVFHVPHFLKNFLDPVFADADIRMLPHDVSHAAEWSLMGVAILSALIAIYVAYNKYIKLKETPVNDGQPIKFLHKVIYNKYYVDEFYSAFISKPLNWLSVQFQNIIEHSIIDFFIQFIGRTVVWSSGVVRLIQTGNTGFYIFAMVISIAFLLFFKLLF
ncbi:MAG TPA: NADH-quinone oxidoreductase subunit L [Bacteroidia bacterium]|nr:NADH-quinone oxidoreductase subunit L [Bacteroidia bacterium]